jgi:hypothetical protein
MLLVIYICNIVIHILISLLFLMKIYIITGKELNNFYMLKLTIYSMLLSPKHPVKLPMHQLGHWFHLSLLFLQSSLTSTPLRVNQISEKSAPISRDFAIKSNPGEFITPSNTKQSHQYLLLAIGHSVHRSIRRIRISDSLLNYSVFHQVLDSIKSLLKSMN